MEAFHYRYHPAAVRFGAIVAAGEIGRVVHARARMAIPWFAFDRNDIRCVCARGDGGGDCVERGGSPARCCCMRVNMIGIPIGLVLRVAPPWMPAATA
jgi:hypothetical protein